MQFCGKERTMTKQEAVEVIKDFVAYGEHVNAFVYKGSTSIPIDALNMAIEALRQEPCEDCISRADLQELFNETTTSLMDKIEQKDIEHLVRACVMVTEMIQDAPSVVPKRGEWQRFNYTDGDVMECTNCGYRDWGDVWEEESRNYCPNCGARMESDGE